VNDEHEPSDAEQPQLFEVEPDWKDHWVGMPDYSHADLQPDSTLLVHFRSAKDRAAFSKLVGQHLHERTKFIWHPKAEILKASDKVFTGKKVVPRHPVYIISKGRADTRLTSRALEWIGVPYHIVVEPQERDAYAAVIDPAKILVLPFSNLGLGGIPARNFVWDHAVSVGAERHWILDDNISGFCRFQDNLKVELDNGATFCAIEDWVDRYENMAMAAFNYDYFAPRKQGAKIKPITLNTRCYSGILLRNDLTNADGTPVRWRGRYNEDTDLSLRLLKAGNCTALFNAFLMYKKPTLTMKGGNTDELYKGAEAMAAEWEAHAAECKQCRECTDGYPTEAAPSAAPCEAGRAILAKDGRWLMAESLREQHPDVTTVERKWRRWQHQVDYRRFQPQLGLNVPKLRADAKFDVEYDLELGAMPAVGSAGSFYQAPTKATKAPKVETPTQVRERPAPATEQSGGPSALAFVLAQPEPEQPAPTAGPVGAGKAPDSIEKPALAEPSQPAEPSQAVPWIHPPSEAEREAASEVIVAFAAARFASELRARGHRLLTRDRRLFTSESSRLTEDDRAALKLHKDELIKLAEPMPVVVIDNPPTLPAAVVADGVGKTPDALGGVERAQFGDEAGGGIRPPASAVTFFDDERPTQSLAQFLGSEPPRVDPNYVPDEPPILDGIDEIVLNFATDGLDWANGNLPVGVTVSTLDGQLTRFLPFRFRGGGNLSEETIKRWYREQIKGKRILGANTRFEVHMSREWGADLEEQGCTATDVMHYAALLDDHRKRFALDGLVADYLPDERAVDRLDESDHAGYSAAEAAPRERYTAAVTAKLRNAMWPLLDKEDLQRVRALEDDVIFPVVEMEKNGALIDVPLLEQYSAEVLAEHGKIMREISDEAGFAFEHTAKGWERLFEKLGVPPSDSYAEKAIAEVNHPLVKKAYFASQLASLDSKTFAAYRKHIDANGVMRFDINQLRGDDGGTVSGRFSIGYVQQVPNADNHTAAFGDRWFPRRIFISATGLCLEGDAAQIEYRILAHLAENPRVLEAYRNDPKLSYHKMTWEMIKQYKADMLYTHQKSFNFARQYGAKLVKLAIMMGFITEREGAEIRAAKRWNDPRLATIREIEAAYAKMLPEGDALLDKASHLAKSQCDEYCKRGDKLHRDFPHRGFVKTLLGRRSRFPHNYKTYIGLNRVIQGTGADVMKRKLVELHKERKNTGLLMRLTVHDAVIGDAQEGTLQKVDEVLNKQSFDFKVPILWECGVGSNWAEAK
jgi:DNA polymerase I-like protein with 3'-5' exonuclease and polymerase domains